MFPLILFRSSKGRYTVIFDIKILLKTVLNFPLSFLGQLLGPVCNEHQNFLYWHWQLAYLPHSETVLPLLCRISYKQTNKAKKQKGQKKKNRLCPECSATGMGQFLICKLKWDLLRTSVTACTIDKNTFSAPFGIFYVRTEI